MIFRPELAKLVHAGRKTQTRRRCHNETNVCRYQPGKSYSVQPGRGKPGICRITVTEVRMEPLGDISLRDAKREGFVTTDEFFDYWAGLHGAVDRDQPVWVVSFVLGDVTDTPRLLAARPGAPHGDYVTNPHLALRDEGEAVDAATQAKLTGLGTLRWEQERAVRSALEERRALHERLRELERAHQRGDVDLSRQLAAIRRRLKTLRDTAA